MQCNQGSPARVAEDPPGLFFLLFDAREWQLTLGAAEASRVPLACQSIDTSLSPSCTQLCVPPDASTTFPPSISLVHPLQPTVSGGEQLAHTPAFAQLPLRPLLSSSCPRDSFNFRRARGLCSINQHAVPHPLHLNTIPDCVPIAMLQPLGHLRTLQKTQ